MRVYLIVCITCIILIGYSTLFSKGDTIISESTTWTSNQYIIGELIIEKGVSLQIDKGVTVLMQPGMSVIVNGALKAVGTLEQPIVFNVSLNGIIEQRVESRYERFNQRRIKGAFSNIDRWGRILFSEDSASSLVDEQGEYQGQTILKHVRLVNSYEDFSIDIQSLPVPSRKRKFYFEGVSIEMSGGIRGIDAGIYLKEVHLSASNQTFESAVRVATTITYFNGFSYLHVIDSVFEGYRSGLHVENCAKGSVSKVVGSTFKNLESGRALFSSCNCTVQNNEFHSAGLSFTMPAGGIEVINNQFLTCHSDTIDLLQTLPQNFVIKSNTFSNCRLESSDALIKKPSWQTIHQMLIQENTFDSISSSRSTAHILAIDSDMSEVLIQENTFTNVFNGTQSTALFLLGPSRGVKIWNNDFRDSLSNIIKVTSFFDRNPVVDARFNHWTNDSLDSMDIRSYVQDFEMDNKKSYVSLFPAFVGPEKRRVIYSSSSELVENSNIISEDQTWNNLNSKLNHSRLIIEYGAMVRVEPGTTLQLPKGAYIVVLGTIHAKGTPNDNIVFSTEKQEDTWNSLILTSTASSSETFPSVIEYVKFDRASSFVPTIEISTDSKFLIHNIQVIKDKRISGGQGPCVYGFSRHLNLDVRHSYFQYCYEAVKIDSSSRSFVQLRNNTFEKNDVGIDCSKSKCLAQNNRFNKNAIGVLGLDLTLIQNDFVKSTIIALRSKGSSILKNNNFDRNTVDVEITGTSFDHIWEKNQFNSPEQHFFQSFSNQVPNTMNLTDNVFLYGKCSLRSPIAIEFSSKYLYFDGNVVEGCVCDLGDVVKLSGVEKTRISYNRFSSNVAYQAPSSRENPSIFTTEQPYAEFKYNVMTSDNQAKLYYYREGASSAPLSVSLNYWGVTEEADILKKIGGESIDGSESVSVSPFFISEDTHELNNLRCPDNYELNGLVCEKMEPPTPTPTPKPSGGEGPPKWSAPMIILVTMLWLAGGVVLIAFFTIIALFISNRRRTRPERYQKQQDVELPSVQSPTAA